MCRTMQYIGFICSIIGIFGIAGAIERETGMMQSLILFAAGAFILYRIYQADKGSREHDRKKPYSSRMKKGRRIPNVKGTTADG